jgi:hypothetical protein
MVLASTRGRPGVLAMIGRTSLTLLELPEVIAPEHGGWLIVLEAEAGSVHAACDLVRIPDGMKLGGAGIVRALLLSSTDAGPDPVPASWERVAGAPFVVYEEAAPGSLPLDVANGEMRMRIAEVSASTVGITIGETKAEVPRFWLARMLHRVAMHGLRLGYAETYGGFFVDDREDHVRLGVRGAKGSAAAAVTVPRAEAVETIERMYRAVAPKGYRERPE